MVQRIEVWNASTFSSAATSPSYGFDFAIES